MTRIFSAYLLVVLINLFTGCQKEETVIAPQLKTASVGAITGTTATSGGSITSDGGAPITVRGVCWSTMASPTIADAKTNDGEGTSQFSSSLTGLTENTTYHVRAYASNSVGTSYGEDVSFSTSAKPSVTTRPITGITLSSGTGGGNIIDDGGSPITSKGICWSTSPLPTLNDNKTGDGIGIGSYASTITSLTPNTTYYVRAYAVNAVGTSYGDEISFATYAVMDIDGNGYYSVIIGTQVWMTANLKVTTYRNGDPIPNVAHGEAWGSLTSGAYCDYNNEASNSATYGRLYNWYAVSDPRNVAPPGWHVATQTEWNTLVGFLGGDDVAGGKLKETGITHWQSPNTGATNVTGFTALPGGARGFQNIYANLGTDDSWWTATENDAATAFGRYVVFSTTSCHWYSVGKENGSHIRCVKD